MEVTTITVTRSRKVPTEQYGSADASITLAANVGDDEDWEKGARDLLVKARGLVYENLGLKLPAKATADTPRETPQETVKVEKSDDKPASDKKPRGRPRKNAASEPVADDIPDDTPQIRSNPEDRKDPDVDVPDDTAPTEAEAAGAGPVDEDIPDDTESTTGGTSDEDVVGEYGVSDLQSFLTEAVKAKKITAQRVREIISSHGVARTSDLPADKVMVVKQQIEKEIG